MILPLPSPKTKGIIVYRGVYDNIVIGPTAEEQDSKEEVRTDPETLNTLKKKGEVTIPYLIRYKPISSYAGLRPAVEKTDYIIHSNTQNWITVAGIRSTGLTASLGIANYVYKLIEENKFNLAFRKKRAPKSERDIIKEAKDIVQLLVSQSQANNFKGAQLGGQSFNATHPLHLLKGQQQDSQTPGSTKTAKL